MMSYRTVKRHVDGWGAPIWALCASTKDVNAMPIKGSRQQEMSTMMDRRRRACSSLSLFLFVHVQKKVVVYSISQETFMDAKSSLSHEIDTTLMIENCVLDVDKVGYVMNAI